MGTRTLQFLSQSSPSSNALIVTLESVRVSGTQFLSFLNRHAWGGGWGLDWLQHAPGSRSSSALEDRHPGSPHHELKQWLAGSSLFLVTPPGYPRFCPTLPACSLLLGRHIAIALPSAEKTLHLPFILTLVLPPPENS